jgi:hypothetical protein
VIDLIPVRSRDSANEAATAIVDDGAMAGHWLTTMTRHALRAVLRARDERVRARAEATNTAARCRNACTRGARSTARARRHRVVRAATTRPASTGDPEGEPEASRERLATREIDWAHQWSSLARKVHNVASLTACTCAVSSEFGGGP